jgi:tRNA A37 methylthiotransferase MiaB
MEVAPYEFRNFWKYKALPIKDMDNIDGFFPWFVVKYKDIPPQNIPAPAVNIYRTLSPYTYFKQGLGTMLSPDRVGDKIYSFLHREQKEDYTYTYIWVSTGCPNLCSFCAERKVVGMPVSRPVEEIVHEYCRLLEHGKRTFEFIGDDVGSYGLDIGTDLPELFTRLSEIDKNYQVAWVIKHLHPKYIVKYKDDLIKMAGDKKIREIICCFQSGSNRLLELMNRHHSIEQVIQVLTEFRKAIPGIKLATNIIVGFPTETDEEFLQTLHVFDQVYFDRVHMIKYYDAEGSDSFHIFPKVSDHVIHERIKFAKKFLKKRDIYFQTRD